jgi:hypothetical protein
MAKETSDLTGGAKIAGRFESTAPTQSHAQQRMLESAVGMAGATSQNSKYSK